MTEEDIINRAKYLYVNTYPRDMRKAAEQAVRELIDTPYIRDLAANFDISIEDYSQSIYVGLCKECGLI